MSDVDMVWYRSDDDEGALVGTLDYWDVFNTEAALFTKIKKVRKQLDFYENDVDSDRRGIEVLQQALDSVTRAHGLFRKLKSDMAKEYHEKTGAVDRTESDT